MKYIELLEKLKEPVFSIQDLKMVGQKIIPLQFSTLTKNKQIIRLKNGLYVLTAKKELIIPENIAFRLYEPSYISLEWALQAYGLIPEIVYNVTSITTKTTRSFSNDFGLFIYKNIKTSLFWGYKKEEKNGQSYLIAEPEKALLDYIYLNRSQIGNDDAIRELRLNQDRLQSLNWKKTDEYLKIFANKKLTGIINKIKCSL